jgi:hypothetical protein
MRTRRLVGTSTVIVMSLALYFAALIQTAAAQSSCTLTVEPEVATAGSEFILRGSGFTPTELILQKEGAAAVTVELDLDSQDPFDIPIGSRKGDEGRWHATASLPGVCAASVVFTATLESTDALSDLLAAPPANGRLPLWIALLVLVTGLGGGAFVAWRLNRA